VLVALELTKAEDVAGLDLEGADVGPVGSWRRRVRDGREVERSLCAALVASWLMVNPPTVRGQQQ